MCYVVKDKRRGVWVTGTAPHGRVGLIRKLKNIIGERVFNKNGGGFTNDQGKFWRRSLRGECPPQWETSPSSSHARRRRARGERPPKPGVRLASERGVLLERIKGLDSPLHGIGVVSGISIPAEFICRVQRGLEGSNIWASRKRRCRWRS